MRSYDWRGAAEFSDVFFNKNEDNASKKHRYEHNGSTDLVTVAQTDRFCSQINLFVFVMICVAPIRTL